MAGQEDQTSTGPRTVWVYEPTRDDHVEGVYATAEAAVAAWKLTDYKIEGEAPNRFIPWGDGYFTEYEVEG